MLLVLVYAGVLSLVIAPLAWLAARDPVLAGELGKVLGPRGGGHAEAAPHPGDGSLGIGSLRGQTS